MSTENIILADNELLCQLTGKVKKANAKENNIQSTIRMMNEEYGFALNDMGRDFSISYDDAVSGKKKKFKLDLVIFEKEKEHIHDNIIRICTIHDEKVKESNDKKGPDATIKNIMWDIENCDFGLWTNGLEYHYFQKSEDGFGNEDFEDIADFPGEGETVEDLNRPDRSSGKVPVNDSLVRTFKRCHDYIHGNEGRKKDAFWQLLYLIFCKLHDEKSRFIPNENGDSYRRRFWVGLKEKNTPEGQKAVAERIKEIFDDLKHKDTFSEVFDGNEAIGLTDRGLAIIAGELAKYSFLDASVDVKGMAYETIVSNTLKQEAGQFFTPRNVIKAMVEMMNPDENMRVLDPACGSGGFLVMVMDHVRKQMTRKMYPNVEGPKLEVLYNSLEINLMVKDYAEKYVFGFDFDPDLKKAARMNMVMAGDGHANIFHVNSLGYPNSDNTQELEKIQEAIEKSITGESAYGLPDARGKFDLIFTNPPFGAKVEVDPEIAKHYYLAQYSTAPEVLFIEACHNYLKPGGRMGIVLPDGILGNPNTLKVREWILNNFKLLASVDLPVETFLPQVGVQASLLFLQKKTEEEVNLALAGKEDYDVFMAIAEKVGKDRRGNPIHVRDEDGAEILFQQIKRYLVREKEYSRIEKVKRVDDDLPKISEEYLKQLNLV
jgi:type I restriction enzyme M protein